jgi:hypothetical protein
MITFHEPHVTVNKDENIYFCDGTAYRFDFIYENLVFEILLNFNSRIHIFMKRKKERKKEKSGIINFFISYFCFVFFDFKRLSIPKSQQLTFTM